MSQTTTPKKTPLRFDPGKLEQMQEPLILRVEKVRNGRYSPIDLPPRDDESAPGMMWDKDSIRRLESWLVNEWSGGGVYRIQVVDANQEKMEWEVVYDTRNFPERIPPTMSGVIPGSSSPLLPQGPNPLAPSAPPVTQQPQTVQQGVSMPNGHWPPQASAYQPIMQGSGYGFGNSNFNAPATVGPPTLMPPPPWGSSPNNWVGPSWSPPPRVSPPVAAPTASSNNDDHHVERYRRGRQTAEEEFERRKLEEHTKALQDQLQRMERDKLEIEHKAQLERTAQAHAQQMASLQDEIRRISEKATAMPVADPQLQQVREERDRLEREREKMELKQIEAERVRAERDRLERDKLERERNEDKINRRFEEMMAMIAKMAEAPKGPTGPDPAVVALQEQIRRQEEEMRRERERTEREREKMELDRRDRERADADRREREQLKEDMRRKDEETRRMFEEMKLAAQTANRGPDPMIEFLKESSRQQIDAMRDITHAQQVSAERMQSFMMSPQSIISMVKDSSNGMDTLQRNVMGIYNGIFDTQRQLIEQAAQLNGGGGDPASVRILEQGIARASEFASKYMGAKKAEAEGHARVQQTMAEAQSRAWQAQHAAAQAAAAQAQATQASYAQSQENVRSAGLGGTEANGAYPMPPASTPKKPKKTAAAPAQEPTQPQTQRTTAVADDGYTDPETGATVAKVIPLRRLGQTDEEWFGPALDNVQELRQGVKTFLESIQAKPPRLDPKTGDPIGIAPAQAVMMITRAANYIAAEQVKIKAFNDLYMKELYADFTDILIPDAPLQYRADCVEILVEISRQASAEANGEDLDDEEDEEDEEDEDGEEGNDEEYNDEDEEAQ